MRSKLPIALAGVLALGLSACSTAASDTGSDAAGTTTLKVSTIGLTSDAGLMLGIDKGFFKDEGLEIEVSTVANPPAGIAAAQSGQIDLAYTPTIPLLNAMSQGVPLSIVAAADGYEDGAINGDDLTTVDDTGLVVAKDAGISSPKDLEGKAVAIPARKAQLEVTVSKLIKDDGGDPAKVNWMVLDFASAVQSLKQGRVDAAALVAPFIGTAQEAGGVLLSSPGIEFFREGAVGVWVAGQPTVDGKHEALAKFQTAINKANAYANENTDEVQAKAAEVTKQPLEDIQSGTDTYWPTEVRAADVERVNKALVELGFLTEEVNLDQVLFTK
ncbi:sulfonate ABC transporter substrate-binding protein [Arthrobacter sp. CAU 1506]|uniref:ABC transporter substrate-binding protein n=1 Tax=Arthrobacter sp. CAU 1506 TaxID=2560052 RepID=UPI0010AD4FC8|nr:ABC transporter substrate-binding protein [Arthrobacter sp. CAU 1506]TJY63676.1 sulfonate ABC transporter substrate-binding protein [Arthrobacter sp. CAU 1506]